MNRVKEIDPKAVVNAVFDAIDEKKGNDIKILEFNPELTSICDYFVIAHGESERQVKAIAENVEYRLRKGMGVRPVHTEGTDTANWIVIDYLDVIVHLFTEEARKFYAIENLWADAEIYTEPMEISNNEN